MIKTQFSRLLLISSLLIGLAACTTASAPSGDDLAQANLRQSMQVMASSLKTYRQASDTDSAYAALQRMQQAVNTSKTKLPHKIQAADTAQVQAYQSQLNQLNATITQAMQLLAANQLTAAQALGDQMLHIRDAGHQQFR